MFIHTLGQLPHHFQLHTTLHYQHCQIHRLDELTSALLGNREKKLAISQHPASSGLTITLPPRPDIIKNYIKYLDREKYITLQSKKEKFRETPPSHFSTTNQFFLVLEQYFEGSH